MEDIIKKITDKKFESVINGYSSNGVDGFLDSIINDLIILDKEYKLKIDQYEDLLNQNKLLKTENEKLKSELNLLKKSFIKNEDDINIKKKDEQK